MGERRHGRVGGCPEVDRVPVVAGGRASGVGRVVTGAGCTAAGAGRTTVGTGRIITGAGRTVTGTGGEPVGAAKATPAKDASARANSELFMASTSINGICRGQAVDACRRCGNHEAGANNFAARNVSSR